MSSNILILTIIINTICYVSSAPIETTSLYQHIQTSTEPHCPALRTLAQTTPEPEYLRPCSYPSDRSNPYLSVRCNLYLENFNLLCSLNVSLTPQIFGNASDLVKPDQISVDQVCALLNEPLKLNNSDNTDHLILRKCTAFCVNVFNDKIEPICIGAAYVRTAAISIRNGSLGQHLVRENPREVAGIIGTSQKIAVVSQAPVNSDVFQSSGEVAPPFSSLGASAPAEPPTGAGTAPTAAASVAKTQDVNNLTVEKTAETPKVVESVQNEDILPVQQEKKGPQKSSDIPNVSSNIASTVNKKISTEPAPVTEKVPAINEGSESDDGMELAAETEKGSEKGFGFDEDVSQVDRKPDTQVVHEKPSEINQDTDQSKVYPDDRTIEDDSYFFTYFMMLCVVFIFAYVGYHNKQKIIAIVVEGRRGRRPPRGRRPNSANYHKLDSNLEEAVSSNIANKNTSKVIY